MFNQLIGDESAVGTWTISITDEIAGVEGTFISWAISVEGHDSTQ